jgi:deazaflavin-dependent oxidoreductase (nitroreductase family)
VYHRIDGRLLIIASTGGGPRNPGWFDNLVKNSSVTVELGGQTWEGRAVLLSGAERDSLFAAVVKATPTFGRYQERTERTIPVVELLPAKS